MKKSFIRVCSLLFAFVLLMSIFTGCTKNDASKASGESKKEAVKFPEKPIQLTVPVAAGGSSDISARALAKAADKVFKKPMVVVNKPGGSSVLGVGEVAKAKPDGYSIVQAPVGALVVIPQLDSTGYTYKDLEPIALASEESIVIVAKKGKFNTLEDLVKYGKANPGKIKYGTSAIGGPVHLVMAQLSYLTKMDAQVVGFKGNAEVKAAILGGHIDVGTMHPQEALPIIQSGDAVILAVSAPARVESIKDIPTLKELGYDIDFTVWKGYFAPKGLPEGVKKALVDGFKTILTDKDLIAEMKKAGLEITYQSPEELSKRMEKEAEYYKKVIKDTNLAEQKKASK